MNDRSPFENYLTDWAAGIDVPGAGTGAIADRARARRRRRRTGSAAVLGVAVLLGGAVVGQGLRSDDDAQEVESYGAAIVDPTLDWTTVDVEQGLGWSTGMAQRTSGELYGISTAPGPLDDSGSLARRLYRSDDGAEWAEVPLPGGLSPNALAADGDTMVAVGTSAAGGDVRVQLARSTSPDDGWSISDIALDLEAEAEAAGFPGRLFVSGTATAARDGRTVVAVTVGAEVDAAQVLPGEADPDVWYATAEGMTRSRAVSCDGSDGPDVTSAPTTSTITTPPGAEPEMERCESVDGVQGTRTWVELGYGDEVAQLVAGRTHVFASDETGGFGPVAGFEGSRGVDTTLLAGDDGFWLLSPSYDGGGENVMARRSEDGLTWTDVPVELPGSARAIGLLDGRVAVLADDWAAKHVVLHTLSAVGVESSDLTELIGLTPDGERYVAGAGIGPLGVALAVTSSGGGAPGVVLHSIDGVSFSRTELPAAPEGRRQTVNGLTMTADAVKVRLNVRDADDAAAEGAPDQRLLVGTPR